jgi:Protein of unknown function (DUF1566)/Divergent InlB B-repeat domain
MKKLFLFLFILLLGCLLIVFVYNKKEQGPTPSETTRHTLTYTAGANGTIKGAASQVVEYGGSGSPVTAVPAPYYHFESWSDGVATPERSEQNITADIAVTASFAVNRYATLTYTAGENGSIDGAASQAVVPGTAGSAVTAVPAAGYHFVSWSDGSTANPRTDQAVTADITVTAAFAINQYALTYSAEEHGSIDGVSPQHVDHGGAGSKVTAVPAENYHFAGWSDGVTTVSRTDRKMTADLAVTARFAIEQYTLVYSAEAHGTIDGASRQTVNSGAAGSTVTAIPAAGYHFEGWSDGVANVSRTDADVRAEIAVTATFAINQYALSYTAGENGRIDGVMLQKVAHGGNSETVTAIAAQGYHFVSWSDGVTTPQRSDSEVRGELTVSALFAVNTYSVGGRVAGLLEGTQVVLQNNAGDDLAITANGEFTFAAELLDTAGYAVTVLTQPTAPNQVCTVGNGTGSIPEADVDDITVTCVLKTYTIGGKVAGIPEGNQVVLQNNAGDDLTVDSNGTFVFATPLDDGSPYLVKVAKLPEKPNWTCEVENGTGSLTGLDIGNVIVDCFPRVVVQATAGLKKVKLKWNSHDFGKGPFDLCLAQEEIPVDGFSRCNKLKGGVLKTKLSEPHTVSGLINDHPYWFQLEASYVGDRRILSEVVKATPFGGLNDTGVDWCSDDIANQSVDGTRAEKSASCKTLAATHPGQDALFGRDASARARKLGKTGHGSAGFDFTKLCRSGEAAGEGKCPPNPSPGDSRNNWACNRDNVTGLTWEVKTDDGPRGQSNTYSWYNPDKAVNGGDPGLKNGGKCASKTCDTQAYAREVNALGLCGASDWRLPTRRELLSIVDNGRLKPAIYTRYFPYTSAEHYWTSSSYPGQDNLAWQVYFLYGEVDTNEKKQGNLVRLVRGQTITFGLENPR